MANVTCPRRAGIRATVALACLIAPVAYGPARAVAPNLVTNGSFENAGTLNSTNSELAPTSTTGSAPWPSTLPGWAVTQPAGQSGYIDCLVLGGANNMCGTSYLGPGNVYATFTVFPGVSPDGGNFLAADADNLYSESIGQTVSGLTAGALYSLSFYQAGAQQKGFTGATHDQWQVTFGGTTQTSTLMNVPDSSYVAWMSQTMTFTATATSQTLTFLAVGGPNGKPPMALIDGIALTQVPEPGAIGAFVLCIAGLVGLRYRRARPCPAAAERVLA